MAIALMCALTGCSAVDRITNRDPQAVHEREMTRRYNVCMKQQLGAFGSFASPESRRKAAEICQAVITPGTPLK